MRGAEKWITTEGGFNCALGLMKHIREKHGDYLSISVVGHPEGHADNIDVVEGGLAALPEATVGVLMGLKLTTAEQAVAYGRRRWSQVHRLRAGPHHGQPPSAFRMIW